MQMRPRYALAAVGVLSVTMVGCQRSASVAQQPELRSTEAERVAKTFYLDGAGNLGFGQDSVPAGLREAGYAGDVEIFTWTVSYNMLIDQRATGLLKARAEQLAEKITHYARQNPGKPVNLIALSAGTGVTSWAIEKLPADVMVDNVVFLGSSLSSEFDLTPVLRKVRGQVHTYHSDADEVLAVVESVAGTVDGKWGEKCIGQVGARVPADASAETRQLYFAKLVNHPYQRSYRTYGYTGGHTSGTSEAFVRNVIAPNLLRGSMQLAAGERF